MKYFKAHITQICISRSGVESSFCTPYTCLVFQQRHIQNPIKHLRWSIFAYPVNDFKVLPVYTKALHLRCLKEFCVRLCSDYTWQCFVSSQQISDGIFRIPTWVKDNLSFFEYFRKIALTMSPKNQKRQRLIALIFLNMTQYPCTLKNNIYHSNKRGPRSFFHPVTNPVTDHLLVHSVDKNYVLAVTVERIWLLFLNIHSFSFVPTPKKLLGSQDSEETM